MNRRINHRIVRPIVLVLWTAVSLPTTTQAGTFVNDPARLWPGGVVNYRFDDSLVNVDYCQNSSPMVACDMGKGSDACPDSDTCVTLTNGRCLGGDSADNGWPSCDITNGNADCVSAGVTGGQCTITTVAGPCISMELWAAEANLNFREMNCSNGTPMCPSNSCVGGSPSHYIAWKAWSNTFSQSDSIGRNPDSAQTINVRLTTGVSGWGMAHELGHALGLYHEQSRRDRDNYVDVDTSKVMDGVGKGNWDIEDNSQEFPRFGHGVPEPFDFGSIMMYAFCRFSSCDDSCGNDTDICVNNTAACRPINPLVSFTPAASCCGVPSGDACVGQRNHFSEYDAMTMRFLYPQSGWRFVDQWYDGDEEEGNFVRPYKNFLDGVDVTPNNGTLWIMPGSYSGVGTLDQPMTLRAPIGPVGIGD